MWTNILDMEMLVGTYVWIDFFSQNADLFGWQLREQLVYVELVIFTQVLAVQLGRSGGHGGSLFRRRLWRTTEKHQYYYRGWKKNIHEKRYEKRYENKNPSASQSRQRRQQQYYSRRSVGSRLATEQPKRDNGKAVWNGERGPHPVARK